ncbi:helix-turn-helix domain-containing protein [Paracoccus fistulariae]|uniref:Helix-turn-helix domain-containing protein n=1 Tax=Paracoccus fistulariae TaxID=658446 RepID=A0ABY7SJ47_9RHOB|nr:helix-turn-helix domain-containing protein [Paracoccus fistulariae]MDB6182971.1 helix-turn-helix domain-containing protein [Paracoccus fistulariae]WCR06052.1 helix-turn-helix domain-containing protein [Paracoccus fistulariae]
MSHEATNWAIKQRGLKPTTKIVLWHLCDRFNPDYGCFPSQDRLAHDCEISRSTLNDHLGQLEAVGLLRRVPRLDPVTKRQLPTRYILGFEPGFTPVAVVPCPETGHGQDQDVESRDSTDVCDDDAMADALPCPDFGHGDEASPVSDFSAEPCPENPESRVRISDTNPVREPLSKPVKEEEGAQAREAISDEVFGNLIEALGLDPAALPGWWQGWPPRLHVQRWRDELGLTEAEIIATAEASRQEHPEPPDGPKALDRAMQRAAQRKVEDAGRKRRKAKTAPATKPITDLPAFYADLVNSDRYLPVSAISNTMRDAMLARGLVTPERLRERGVR